MNRWLGSLIYNASALTAQNVRLVDGSAANEGRVEVFMNGEWGTVCDDLWDLKDAKVVCKQLGFPDAIAYKKKAYFGEGNGSIWMDNVVCKGTEGQLQDCFYQHADTCRHDEDAGVICKIGNKKTLSYISIEIFIKVLPRFVS